MSYRLELDVTLMDDPEVLPDYQYSVEKDKFGWLNHLHFSSDGWRRLHCFLEERLFGISKWDSESCFSTSDAGGETVGDNILLLSEMERLYPGFTFKVEDTPGQLPAYRIEYDWYHTSDVLDALKKDKFFTDLLDRGYRLASGQPLFFKYVDTWWDLVPLRKEMTEEILPRLSNVVKRLGYTIGASEDINSNYIYKVEEKTSCAGHLFSLEMWGSE